jgi:predicted transposase/invertase (TIGR01784 family)
VEMEMAPTTTFPARLLYYWAVLHAGQLSAGDGYELLRPTISICFLNRALFPGVADYHLDFHLRSSRHPPLIFSPHQAVHVVELPKFVKTVEELVDPFDVWCYFLTNGESLDPDNLPARFAGPAVAKALEVLKMLKQSELEWHRYQSQLKARRDRAAEITDVRAEGLEKGLLIGDIIGRVHAFQGLLGRPLTPRSDLLVLSLDELRARAAELEREAATRLKN